MVKNTTCSECGGTMQRGFVVDRGHGNYPYGAAYWLEGKPEFRSFLGLKIGIKTEGKQAFYITAYRCERCGFLKFYAGPDMTSNN